MANYPDLSNRQEHIVKFIREFMAEYGYPPSIRQIGCDVGISSTSVVSYNLNVLQRKGYITRTREISRSVRLVDLDDNEVDAESSIPPLFIPMLGYIAAGDPIPIPEGEFVQGEFEEVAVPHDMVRDIKDVYALQVRGTSMVDALIADGDIIIMRHQTEAQNGEMVAVWLAEEKATTLKKLYWEKNHTLVRLQPANPLMEPIFVHPGNLEIQGRVIGVIRHL
ncbi:MAG: transcriptional repressor LexA [Chloroflexi bacterium]|nr:transcriptional repressor LexA [Chloroflexota bacterium]